MTKQKFGLTGTALKTIALVLMVMDHIHYFFEFTGVVPEWFSMLARLSAQGWKRCWRTPLRPALAPKTPAKTFAATLHGRLSLLQ